MLELKNIGKTFNPGTVNEKVALQGVDLHLAQGDFATIVGSRWTVRTSPSCRISSAPRPSGGCFRTRCAAQPPI